MQLILDSAVGNFGGHFVRWLSPEEVARVIETADAAALARKGVYLDPFDPNRRARYTAAEAAELPSGFEPFRVTVVDPEEMILWSEADQIAAAKFASRPSVLDAGLSAADKWLAVRSPFRVTPRKGRV